MNIHWITSKVFHMAYNTSISSKYEVFGDESDDDEFEELVVVLLAGEYQSTYFTKEPCRNSALTGHEYVIEVLRGHRDRCYDSFRMDQGVFLRFCGHLKDKGLLRDSRFLSVEEQVAIFLLTISHNERNRIIAERFQHSGETISRHFKKVLKNCIGAIDGTHIDAYVPLNQQIPYRGKKLVPTQNVMCACSFDMRFTYVMTGWEGTANDSRVFLECVINPENEFPLPPRGKYYLVDSGYTNMPGFLSLFRGERYHLRDYRGRGRHPQDASELFNYTHSSLRNVIERCFGVLKARFPILKQMPPYSLRMQRYIVIACCVVHNFIRMNAINDSMFEEYDTCGENTSEDTVEMNVTPQQLRYMAQIRQNIARSMWEANQQR